MSDDKIECRVQRRAECRAYFTVVIQFKVANTKFKVTNVNFKVANVKFKVANVNGIDTMSQM